MDYKELKKNVRKINSRAVRKNIFSKFVEIVTYVLSLFAIIEFKFFPNNSFVFENNIWSYLTVILCVFLLIMGFKSIYNSVKSKKSIIVSREELHDLINYARYNAEKNVINFAGDLSWLGSDINEIEEIKRIHNNVNFTIYYKKEEASDENLLRIKSLSDNKVVTAISYPKKDVVQSRCMVVDMVDDYQSSGNTKICVYQHCSGRDMQDKFLWQVFTNEDQEFKGAIESILRLLELFKKSSVKIGFSGVNNVGKTTLAKKCYELLTSNNRDVNLIEDAFEKNQEQTDFNNMHILLEQLSKESFTNGKINIFDRTLYDNYKYAYLRVSSRNRHCFDDLLELVNDRMKEYDLIIYVKKKDDKFDTNTTYVKNSERRRMSTYFEDYYRNSRINIKKVVIDFDDFENSIDEASRDIVSNIEKICALKNY